MKLRSSKLLGLAVTDREVACAIVAGGKVLSAARWTVPADLSLDRPDAYGKALRTFLDGNDFAGVSKAIVGLPARWLVTEARDVPPVGREQALATLRLQAERISIGDDKHLIFDAAGNFDGGGGESGRGGRGGRAVLVGLPAALLENLRKALAVAGIEPVAVTATGLAVADAMRDKGTGDRLLVLQNEGAAEVVWQSPHGPRALRHVNTTATTTGGAGALLRAAATVGFTGDRVEIVGVEVLPEIDRARFAEGIGREVELREPTKALANVPAVASLNGHGGRVVGERLWPAVALASMSPAAVPVDFTRPKLAAPKPSRIDRRYVLGGLAALTVVMGITWLWMDAVNAEQRRDQLEALVVEREPEVEAGEAEIARFNFGRTFYEKRPPVLDCLATIASAFGYDDPIWTTSFTMNDAGVAQLQGRATDQMAVLKLRDALVAHPDFTQVQLRDLREARSPGGSRGGESNTFTLSFTYIGPSNVPAATEEVRP